MILDLVLILEGDQTDLVEITNNVYKQHGVILSVIEDKEDEDFKFYQRFVSGELKYIISIIVNKNKILC